MTTEELAALYLRFHPPQSATRQRSDEQAEKIADLERELAECRTELYQLRETKNVMILQARQQAERIKGLEVLLRECGEVLGAYDTDETREFPEGLLVACDGVIERIKRALTADRPARHQPCGCVLCVCEDEERCHGCGAVMCKMHRAARAADPSKEGAR